MSILGRHVKYILWKHFLQRNSDLVFLCASDHKYILSCHPALYASHLKSVKLFHGNPEIKIPIRNVHWNYKHPGHRKRNHLPIVPAEAHVCWGYLALHTTRARKSRWRQWVPGPNLQSRRWKKHKFLKLEVKAETQRKLIFATCSNLMRSYDKQLGPVVITWLRSFPWLPWEMKPWSYHAAFSFIIISIFFHKMTLMLTHHLS